MKTRLAILISLLILLPPLALSLAEQDWPQDTPLQGNVWGPALIALISLILLTLSLDHHTHRRTGTSLLRTQTNYSLWLGFTGAIVGEACAYLNIFAPLWSSPLGRLDTILLASLLGAGLLPGILVLRLWLASWAGLLRMLSGRVYLPSPSKIQGASLTLLTALIGLLGGTAWPDTFLIPFWMAPLLLMVSLQLLWQESVVFSGLVHGDWSRTILGSSAGLLVISALLGIYRLTGGEVYFTPSCGWLALLWSAFGLLCLQLGDVIAEHWRGKQSRGVLPKKPFPIPVVTQPKKD